jgi:hypothetical protein
MILDEFRLLTAPGATDWAAAGQATSSHEIKDHPTLRRAVANQADAVSLLGGLRRRQRKLTLQTYVPLVATGYSMARYALGTYFEVPSYGLLPTEVDDEMVKLLDDKAQAYPFDGLLSSLGELLPAFRQLASEPCPMKLGQREQEAFQFNALLDGVRFALAEEELFGLRRST